jgi:hypothetical protein
MSVNHGAFHHSDHWLLHRIAGNVGIQLLVPLKPKPSFHHVERVLRRLGFSAYVGPDPTFMSPRAISITQRPAA